MKNKLVARVVSAESLTPDVLEDAFALFRDAYADADRERFQGDLAEKQLIILLRDRESGALKGFSTVLVQSMDDPAKATIIFSGDTVIHRDYWGQKQLQIAFTRILLSLKLRSPLRPLYWFLISKGYRTYMLLANAFPRAVPRYDGSEDARLRATLDALATARFGSQYQRGNGIVRYALPHERVRDGVAPITQRHLDNPHVRFFVERNPGHGQGDELACLAEVRLVDLIRVGARIALTLTRRALVSRGLLVGASTGHRAGGIRDIRHAEEGGL
jgi:hypothetical protein